MVWAASSGSEPRSRAQGVVGGSAAVAEFAPSERDALELGGLETEGLELGDDVGGGDKFVVRGAAASAQSVRGEERHFAVHVGGDVVLGEEQIGGEQDEENEGAGHS